jgi:hypothetical protein
MKRNFKNVIGASAIALSMAVLPSALPANAQVVEPEVERAPGVYNEAYDNDFDWGWIGLLGLIGLAGLAGGGRRNRGEDVTRYRDPNASVGSTTYRE